MLQRRRLNRPHRSATATVLATALIGSAIVSGNQILHTQSDAIDPVDAALSTASFDSGDNVLVDDPAIKTQGDGEGPRTVKQFTRDEEFSQFALTWTGSKDVAAFVRSQRADGSWSEWFPAEPIETASHSEKTGTDLIYVEPTHTVQVSVSGIDIVTPPPADPAAPAATPSDTNNAANAVAPLPTNFGAIKPVAEVAPASDFEAVFIDGGESSLPANGIQLTADSDGMPRVISRAGWGADESLRCSSPTYDDDVKAIVIHHTAGSNNYTETQAPGIVRGVYKYHAQTLGWCDIGYQSLADKYGNLYEGRYGGLNKPVEGAHAGGFNENTWAISMMGNYDTVQPTKVMINAVGELAGWRAKVAGFDPTGSTTHYSEGSSYTFYPYGTPVVLKNIFAHRDVGNTTCPGQYGYAQMDTIRSIAKAKYDSIISSFGTTPSISSTTTEATTSAATTTSKPASIADASEVKLNNEPTPANAKTVDTLVDDSLVDNLTAQGLKLDTSLLATAGTLAAAGVAAAASQGLLGNIDTVGDLTVAQGLKISDIQPVVKEVVSFIDDPTLNQAYNTLNATLGPVLGEPRSGLNTYINKGNEVTYVLFDQGIMLSSELTGVQALWGEIANLWAQQGFDAGPLGLPLKQEYRDGNKLRVDFQGGYVTFDPATGALDATLH